MCVCVCVLLCVVWAFFLFEYVCVLFGMYCVMMHGLFWLLCLCVALIVFVCGVCRVLCDAVWRVRLFCVIDVCLCVLFHVFVGVVCDLLCGDVWFGFVCVVFICV